MDERILQERYERAVREQVPDFETFFLAKFFDLSFSYGDQTCRVDIPVADYMFSGRQTLHGGVVLFLFDVSMGHLCKKFASPAVTLEMKTQFIKPISGPAYCEARFLKRGGKVIFLESRLFDAQDELAAVATGTFYCREHPPIA